MFNFVLGTSMLMLVSVLAPAAVVYNKELKSFYYEQKDKWFGVSTPVVVLSKPVHSGISIGVNHTKSSDVSDVIDVDFVPTYDEVLAEVRGGVVSSDVVEDTPTYEEVLAAYKKVRAKASSKTAQGLTVEGLIEGAKRAAQFPAGYFHAACDFPQVDTPGRYTKSQQPLANFARIFKLSRDDHEMVINNQSWRNSLLHCFAKATDAELFSVCHSWSHLTSGDTYNYIYIINFVLVLRNEANN